LLPIRLLPALTKIFRRGAASYNQLEPGFQMVFDVFTIVGSAVRAAGFEVKTKEFEHLGFVRLIC
jgi:hypothetical protein